jgi:uncharacterized membrane protein
MSFLTTYDLTVLGAIHTAIGLAAVAAGIVAFVRDGAIRPDTAAGRIFVITTLITVVTGFFIFRRGGFGNPHALGIVTLMVLAVAALAGRTPFFGQKSPYVETVAYSLSFFLHFIPATAESFLRLPVGAPLAAKPEDPIVQGTVGVLFLLFLAGVWLQVRRLRARRVATTAGPLPQKSSA